MFGLGKKKAEKAQIVSDESSEESSEEITDLKEYIGVDSIKAHLVDTLEENRRLKKEAEESRDHDYKRWKEEQKKTEVALIEADEWKKRAKEKDEEIKKLKQTIDKQDEKIEEMTSQQNSLKVDAEMAREEARKTRKRYEEKEDCAGWLRNSLKKYCGYEWEKVTKTQLVSVLKKILEESENVLAAKE